MKNLKNNFLVAMPGLVDPNFSKSVIYIYEYNKDGAMGLVINKPLPITLGAVLKQLKLNSTSPEINRHPVHMGGPVGQDLGFVVHANDNNKILISTSKETLADIALGKGPSTYIIALGYSGWEAGQLEKELARNDWLIVPFDFQLLFTTPAELRWQKAAELLGIDIHRLSDQVGHA